MIINCGDKSIALSNDRDILKEFIYSFLKEKAITTQKVYSGHLREFIQFIKSFYIDSIKEVRYSHIIAYRDKLIKKGLSDNTINIKLACVRSFFKFLNLPFDNEGQSYLTNNVTQHIKKIKVDHYSHNQVFDPDLYQKILSDLKDDTLKGLRDKIIFLIFGYCALRKSELLNLKVSSIYEEDGISYYKVIGKGNKTIDKELPYEVFDLIKKLIHKCQLQDSDYLLFNMSNSKRENKKLSDASMNKIINTYAKKYNFKKAFRVHSLRSMSAIEVYNKTKDIQLTQQHLNHTSVATTQIYLNKVKSKKVGYYDILFK